MKAKLLEHHEMDQLDRLLMFAMHDTKRTWNLTRIHGHSASMSSDGNVSIQLLKAFDLVTEPLRAENAKLREELRAHEEQFLYLTKEEVPKLREESTAFQNQCISLKHKNHLLREQRDRLVTLAMRSHYYCEDPWYSCPKAEDGCANVSRGAECDCGADEHNAEVRAILAEIGEGE